MTLLTFISNLSEHESWVLEDGIIKEGSYNIERGVGVRAINGEKTGFAYSDELSESALIKACKAARSIASDGGKTRIPSLTHVTTQPMYSSDNPLAGLQEQEKNYPTTSKLMSIYDYKNLVHSR